MRAVGFWQSGLAGRLAGSVQAGMTLSALGGGVGTGVGVGVATATGVCCAGDEEPPQLASTTEDNTRPSPAGTLLRTINTLHLRAAHGPRASNWWPGTESNRRHADFQVCGCTNEWSIIGANAASIKGEMRV